MRTPVTSIIDSSSKLSADVYTNLASTKRRVSDKLKMLAILPERQHETTPALNRFMSFLNKGKGTAGAHATTSATTTATAQGTTPAAAATTHGIPLSPAAASSTGHTQGGWISAERFLNELRPLLLGRNETARRPAMKVPDTHDGTHSKLRPWWELVKDYMEIHEPTMPTESIQIKFVGSLLRDEARRWYDTRKRSMENRNEQDSWGAFSEALLECFTDSQETRHDYDRMKALRYEGLIQDYLSRLEEINSRVGISGPPLQDIILRQLTLEMGRVIFHKAGSIPKDDETLIKAVREAGIMEEEFLHTQGKMKGSAQKKPADNNQTQPGDNSERPGKVGRSARRSGKAAGEDSETLAPQSDASNAKEKPEKKDFSHLTKLWDNPKAAFQGVPFEETKKHKDMGRDCQRCGHNGHHSIHCRAGKTVGGTVLPPYPGKKIANDTGTKPATTAATKRKRIAAEDDSHMEQPPAQKERTAAVIASASQPPIWASSDDDSELSDF